MSPLIEILSSSALSGVSTSRLNLVKASASAIFNLSRLSFEESVSPSDDDILSVIVALVESLKILLEKGASENKDLERLLVVGIGGFVVLANDSASIKEVLESIEAVEIIGKVGTPVGTEIIGLIKG
jgi:PUL domain